MTFRELKQRGTIVRHSVSHCGGETIYECDGYRYRVVFGEESAGPNGRETIVGWEKLLTEAI
jgi:hypothetical protein